MDVLTIPFFMFRRYIAQMVNGANSRHEVRSNDDGTYLWGQGVLDEILKHDKHLHSLMLKAEVFQPGWCILLPNGRSHNAANDSDMFSYITGY